MHENLLPIVVYGKPQCAQCAMTERKLKELNLPYRKIDVTVDENAYNTVMAMGYQQAPVVVVPFDWQADASHWSGFNPGYLESIAPR